MNGRLPWLAVLAGGVAGGVVASLGTLASISRPALEFPVESRVDRSFGDGNFPLGNADDMESRFEWALDVLHVRMDQIETQFSQLGDDLLGLLASAQMEFPLTQEPAERGSIFETMREMYEGVDVSSPDLARGLAWRNEISVMRLTNGGFDQERAEQIVQRENELRVTGGMMELEARHDAMRAGRPLPGASLLERQMRAELGESDYELYRRLLGYSTDVGVTEVLPQSAAAQAGLVSGDRIVSYDSRRVYSLGELGDMTLEGNVGEPIDIEFVRDGITMYLSVPRGPLGLRASGASPTVP